MQPLCSPPSLIHGTSALVSAPCRRLLKILVDRGFAKFSLLKYIITHKGRVFGRYCRTGRVRVHEGLDRDCSAYRRRDIRLFVLSRVEEDVVN